MNIWPRSEASRANLKFWGQSQPRTLSADIPASQKGIYLFYNPPINFHFAIKPLVNMVKKRVVIWWRMRVIDVRKQVDLIGLANFISTVTGPKLDKLPCESNSRNAPYITISKTRRFWFIFSDLLFKNLTRKKHVSVSELYPWTQNV